MKVRLIVANLAAALVTALPPHSASALQAGRAMNPSESRIPVGATSLCPGDRAGAAVIVLHGGPDFDHGYLLPDLDVVRSADGVGFDLRNASRNRIVNNTIQGIRPREPFHGNSLTGPPPWRDANGAGIWVSPGSDENEIVGNIFEDIASHAIVLEGDRNIVQARSASNTVHDLGTGNRVSRPDAR